MADTDRSSSLATVVVDVEVDLATTRIEPATLLEQDWNLASAAAPTAATAIPDTVVETWISLKFQWNGKGFALDVAESDRVFDLKGHLQKLTNVPIERQKILGLVKGKLPADDARVGDLKLANLKKFTLVGTPAGDELKDPDELEDLPDVLNDFDVDLLSNPAAAKALQNDLRNQRKLKETARKLDIQLINPLRGRHLLVLDIDYTILDTKPLTTGALPPMECARPGLHDFLEAVYPFYDICIWSQTSWIWLEHKLVELGMLGSDRNYKIAFVLDKGPMFSIFNQGHKHAVKPLKLIWTHFPQFSAKNTIHIDDLSRNFALNPGEGLKISPFRDAHTAHAMADRELDSLARYLRFLADVADFTSVNHSNWKILTKSLASLSSSRRQTPPE